MVFSAPFAAYYFKERVQGLQYKNKVRIEKQYFQIRPWGKALKRFFGC